MQRRSLRPRNLNVSYQIAPADASLPPSPPQKPAKKPSTLNPPKPPSPLQPTLSPEQPSSESAGTQQKRALGILKKLHKRTQLSVTVSKAPTRRKKSKSTPHAPITKNHSVASLQSSLPEPPDFEPLKHKVPLHQGHNTLPKALRSLKAKPGDIFNLFFNDDIINVMVTNTNLYAQKQMEIQGTTGLGRNARWEAVTASEMCIWLGITIHMGLIGLPPAHYWRRDGRLLSRDGLPTISYMNQMRFEQLRRYFHVSPPDQDGPLWHSKIDPLLDQIRNASQQYRVPSSNITMDEAMIRFTGRSVHITKMPNKPIGEGYKFFALADKGYVWDFHPSSNAQGLDPVCQESAQLGNSFSNTTKMVHHLVRRLYLRHRKKAWNIYMDNYFTTVPLLAELRRMGVGGCGTAKANLKGYPEEFKAVNRKSKLDYHFRSGVVKDKVGCLLWIDSAPVTMMSTIHSLQEQELHARWHPGDKSSNAAGANELFQGERQIDLLVPVVILAYDMYKVGVDVADQYRTYYDTQLRSRRNWYPLFYWALETAIINALIIYRDEHQDESVIDHLEFRLDLVWALIERGGDLGIQGSSLRHSKAPKRNIVDLETPPQKRAKVTKNTKLPPCRLSSGPHLPVYMGGERRDCFLCSWQHRLAGEVGKETPRSRWKCGTCNEALCQTPQRNCFYNFHVV